MAAGLTLVAAPPAQAVTFTVTKTSDTNDGTCDADCSLREAVQAANNLAGADTITLPAGTYTLTGAVNEDNGNSGDLDVKQSLTVVGAGAATTVIDGNDAERIFDVFPSAATSFGLSDLTVRNGNAVTTSFKDGGGMYLHNNVTASLTRVTVTSSEAGGNGGGIEARGSLTLVDSTVSANRAGGFGGGVRSQSSAASLTMTGSTVSGNQADFGGGLVISHNPGFTASITDSAITGNQAIDQPEGAAGSFGNGGGILSTTDGALTITRSVLTGNNAAKDGGAIHVTDGSVAGVGTLDVGLSRITGNTAGTGATGIHQVSGTVTAEKNWWGCNAGPGNAGCSTTSGTVDSTPRVVLRHSASPTSISTGATSTLTADFLTNSDSSANAPADLAAFTGLAVTFGNAVLGSLSGAQPSIQSNGAATATYTAGSTGGSGSADATVDGETETASVTVTRPGTTVTGIARQTPASAATNASSVTFRVTFAAAVSGVTNGNFSVTTSGLSGVSVTGATAVGGAPATQWDVQVGTGSGNGSLRLDLSSDSGISHSVPAFNSGQSYTVDKSAPTVSVTSGPSGTTTSTTASFEFTSGDSGGSGLADTLCTLDGGPATSCVSPQVYTSLGQGAHTFSVTSVDNAGNTSTPDGGTWTVDTAAPDTSLDTTPPAFSNSTDASFGFSGTDNLTAPGSLTFECSLDSVAFAACTSPQDLTGLGAGSHTFAVRAKDAAGQVDGTPATHTWTVDTTAPDTSITANPASVTNDATPTYEFTGSDDVTAAGSLSFACQVDADPYAACTSPYTSGSLSDGSHTFRVVATDQAGTADPTPAAHTVLVDTVDPTTTLTGSPPAMSTSRTATFDFTGADPGGSGVDGFQCRLDSGVFESCVTGKTYTSLPDGPHTFAVRAVDEAGNLDGTPETHAWSVDGNQAPTASSDGYTVTEDTPRSVSTPGVLGNDTDPDVGDSLTAVLVDGPDHGTLALLPTGGFTYTPGSDYSGPDSFTYRAEDQDGEQSAPATVTLTVTPVDDAPVVRSLRGGSCLAGDGTSIRMSVSDVDTPLAALQLSAESSDSGVVAPGGVTFGDVGPRTEVAVAGGSPGSAVLTLHVADGGTTVSVEVGYVHGTAAGESLRGTGRVDVLLGGNGADRLNGKGGNDLVCGGGGDDRLSGRTGDDVLDGHAGADLLKGGAGSDALRGGRGPDRLVGGSGPDRFLPGPGRDEIADLAASEGDLLVS
jgi:CSLREA domain-containing protein